MKLPMPQIDLLGERGSEDDDEIRAQVWGLLTTLYPRNDLVERRHDNRYPFPCLVHLTPVGEDGITPEGETVVVVGKHLSEHGLGFFHRAPLPYRKCSFRSKAAEAIGSDSSSTCDGADSPRAAGTRAAAVSCKPLSPPGQE